MTKFNGWYFQMSDEMVMIVSKEFWDREGCIDDQHITEELGNLLPANFYEATESIFEYSMSEERAYDILLKAGFKEKVLFEE